MNPVPKLDTDRGRRPTAGHIIERQIVWALLHFLVAEFPDRSIVVYDGEEYVKCADPKAAMEQVFGLDEAVVQMVVAAGALQPMGRPWVLLVMGNGEDVVSDYGVNPQVEAAIKNAMVAVGFEL